MTKKGYSAAGGEEIFVDGTKEGRATDMKWVDSGLESALVAAIQAQGRDKPHETLTKVQKHMLQSVEKAGNVYGIAPTGSGKTIAFLAPIIQGMLKGTLDSAVLLTPTNELGKQHIAVMTALAGDIPVIHCGQNATGDAEKLKKAEHSLSVATSEKWAALAKVDDEMAKFMAERVSVIVLDEIDALVGNAMFFKQIQEIVTLCKAARVWALTATRSEPSLDFLKSLTGVNGRDLVHIDADEEGVNHTHESVTVPAANLMPALKALVESENKVAGHKVMIFFNTSHFAEFSYNYLKEAGCENMNMLHTKMSNGAVKKSKEVFEGCSECFLLCSAVMQRGMDFPNVTSVIQVGASVPAEYIQRVGRSGRGDQSGRGVLLLVEEESQAMLKALKTHGKVTVTEKGDLETEANAVTTALPKSDHAFRSLIGGYNTHAKMLGWKMADIVAVIKAVFVGAGQAVPTITAQYAKNAKVGEGDGLEIVGGAGRKPKTGRATGAGAGSVQTSARKGDGKRQGRGERQGGRERAPGFILGSLVLMGAAVVLSMV